MPSRYGKAAPATEPSGGGSDSDEEQASLLGAAERQIAVKGTVRDPLSVSVSVSRSLAPGPVCMSTVPSVTV